MPGCFTSGIKNRQALAIQRPPLPALQVPLQQHPRQHCAAPRHLLVPLEVRRRTRKCSPLCSHQQREYHQKRDSRQQRDPRQQRNSLQQENSTGGH